MSVKEINIVSFCHKNNKLPVTFQQRVTYIHPTGPIPTQEPIIPSNGLLTHPNYPLLLERETSGKFRVIRSTFEGSLKEVSIRFRKRVCGKNLTYSEKGFSRIWKEFLNSWKISMCYLLRVQHLSTRPFLLFTTLSSMTQITLTGKWIAYEEIVIEHK